MLTEREYIDKWIDDPEMCGRYPDRYARRAELARQYGAGKQRQSNTPESAPAEADVSGQSAARAPSDRAEAGAKRNKTARKSKQRPGADDV